MARGSHREAALKSRFGPEWPPKRPGPGWLPEPPDPFAEFQDPPSKPKRARSGDRPPLDPRVARVYRPPNARRTNSPLMTAARLTLAFLVILLLAATIAPTL
jgi:hypothetical protein